MQNRSKQKNEREKNNKKGEEKVIENKDKYA